MKSFFMPMSRQEMNLLGWDELDVLLISGDAYVDHPSFGVAIIGRVLIEAGFRCGIITQPDWNQPESLSIMGTPRLFCGVTAGNMDSMLSNYTAARHKRQEDSYTPGGVTGKRPNRASIIYSELARRNFPGIPVILGGIEASLRRAVHYDYWQDKIRPSILLDSKADLLVYGMGEQTILEVAKRIANQEELSHIAGTARLLGGNETETLDRSDYCVLPCLEDIRDNSEQLLKATKLIEKEQNPHSGKPLLQMHQKRALIIYPPAKPLSTAELDRVYALPYKRAAHPSYEKPIPGFSIVEHSITAVRGCPGGCSFCGLGLHQGRFIQSRSKDSVLDEIKLLSSLKGFKGVISDVGGPTANAFGCTNTSKSCKTCKRSSCLYPSLCSNFSIKEKPYAELLAAITNQKNIRHCFVASGIRMDLALKTPKLLEQIIAQHTSGQLKIAPEHMSESVLDLMRKPGNKLFKSFLRFFEEINIKHNKKQFVVPYFISSFPGCTQNDMKVIHNFLKKSAWNPRQIQDFIPTPMTAATAMYVAEKNFSGDSIRVAKTTSERNQQRQFLDGSKGRMVRSRKVNSKNRSFRR
jgi:uncharacterized radical SAM protein YgiQ